ncbi:MAG: FliM/FliN family flagellar motor C-terminal domain-containing protein [Acidobacteriaceae bacterium]
MQKWMQRWMEQFEGLLEERSGAALTVTQGTAFADHQDAQVLSSMTLDGALRGLLRAVATGEQIVQFVQLARRQPLDAQQALDEGMLAEWRDLLEETASRLSGQLLAEGEGETTVVLREVRPAGEGEVLVPGAEGGAEVAPYEVRAGDIVLHLALLARMETAPAGMDVSQMEEAMDAGLREMEGAQQGKPHEGRTHAPSPSVAGAAEDRGAEAAEARAQWRRPGGGAEETSPFRTHPERLDLLLDIELEATLRFGALEMPLRQVLELGPGDVLQLDRHVQEPVDLVVGDRIVARGEVVLVGGNFGLHVTEVAEPRRRLETIRCLF